jgi:hypothetical protein
MRYFVGIQPGGTIRSKPVPGVDEQAIRVPPIWHAIDVTTRQPACGIRDQLRFQEDTDFERTPRDFWCHQCGATVRPT